MPDPGREERHHELRSHNGGRDHQDGPLAGPGRQHASHERQHGGIGEMEKQQAGGENDQSASSRDAEDFGQ
jgi:hypothetical protein